MPTAGLLPWCALGDVSLLTDGWVTLFLYGWHLVHWLWLVKYLIHHQKWEHSWWYYYYCRVVECLYFVLKHKTDWGLSIEVFNIIHCQYHKLISALWWLKEELWKCKSSVFKIELDYVNPVTPNFFFLPMHKLMDLTSMALPLAIMLSLLVVTSSWLNLYHIYLISHILDKYSPFCQP